ncbi:hypothetical protein PVAG01_01784 [Phlyctema vagabunda]|uniref:Uncharacterized protein n=1 Tax=Phlyctema vagabunda TaxID=108571 RepID=A0ABR4PY26_9HELO
MPTWNEQVISSEVLWILINGGYAGTLRHGSRKISTITYMQTQRPEMIEIPNYFDSPATLRFLELKPATAKDHVNSVLGDAYDQADDWTGIMNRIGVTAAFQARIMSRGFSDRRLDDTAKGWVLEMMDLRYEFLLGLNDSIRRRLT